jgi:hypothetical protein
MNKLLAGLVLVVALGACKSDAEKLCFDGKIDEPNRVSACGEECDQGNEKACATQADVGLQRCMKDRDAETCRWMCHYGKDGKDLYCNEYEKITGKPAE